MAGKFIVFEGIDGCGKQTQIALLAKQLVQMDIRFTLFKYPTEKAIQIKKYLDGGEKISNERLLSLYADDIQSEQDAVEEAVVEGWAIADRYVPSTAAYQGAGGKLDWALSELDRRMWIAPDSIIWMDIGVDEAMRRKKGQKTPDRHESDRKFLSDAAGNYAKLFGDRWLTPNWHKIDANRGKEEVFAAVRKALSL